MIACGPGNNGGDGLVAARHLYHFGYKNITVCYPKRGKTQLFVNLVKQCEDLGISFVSTFPENGLSNFDLVVDSFFGFSFRGPAREPFAQMIADMAEAAKSTGSDLPHILSVDVPSGWDVDNGDVHTTGFTPNAVISLTTPKRCMMGFGGTHYLGGRFLPPNIASQFDIVVPEYGDNPSQILELPVAPHAGSC
jgi:NAD(P)H-hydrate epimerase